ncbi:hypothetical protein Tsubulata_022423, partial [Turnera subulata]
MDSTALYSLLSIFIVYILFKFFLNASKKHKINLPPSPPALPVIGHLHLLKRPIHRSFENLSQKYGPIFYLKLGVRRAVVVSSPSAVEECFTKNDVVFANRPHTVTGKLLTHNYTTMGSAPYGDLWRNLRRIGAVEIFSATRLNNFLSIRKDEVKMLLRRLHRASGHGFAKVEVRPMLVDLTFNIIMRMVAGKRYYGEDLNEVEEAKQFKDVINEYFRVGGGSSTLANLIPILRFVDFTEKKCLQTARNLDLLLQGLIDEHRKDTNRNTMINHLLTLQVSEPEYYTDSTIRSLIQDFLLGGTETTATTLEWALANLLNHPDVLKKAKAELDTQVGQNRLLDESDFPKLPYLHSIISESLRVYPSNPLLAVHSSSGDCTIGGYDVPKGTWLFVNAWSIQRDPKLWSHPTEFNPERSEYEDDKIEAYTLMPFGKGRRACPGKDLANKVLILTLGSLIQCFDWKRVSESKIDMTEKARLTMSRVMPLELLCKARPILNQIFS